MIMAYNKLNASRQRRMLDEIEDGHRVTAELSFRCFTVFRSFLCLAHGGKQGCKLNFTPLSMSSCLLCRWLINAKWLQFSFRFLTCFHPFLTSSVSVTKLCFSGDWTISSWRLSPLLTSEAPLILPILHDRPYPRQFHDTTSSPLLDSRFC